MSEILTRRKEMGEALVRDAVSEAAAQVLRTKGLSALTMDAVAEAADVSKGTLYNYFQNKDELLEAVHERLIKGLEDRLDALFARPEPSVVVVLKEIVHSILDFVDQDRSTLFILHECPSLSETRARHEKEFVDDLAALIQRGIAQGELREQDARSSAFLVLGLLVYASRGPQEHPALCPPVEVLPGLLTEWLMHGLGGRRGTQST